MSRVEPDLYADVVVDLGLRRVDRAFSYGVPAGLAGAVAEGTVVRVPFGRSRKSVQGYVVRLTRECHLPEVKDIIAVEKSVPAITPELLGLARWVADTYASPLADALRCVVPRRISGSRPKMARIVELSVGWGGGAGPDERSMGRSRAASEIARLLAARAHRQAAALEVLLAAGGGPIPYTTLCSSADCGPESIAALARKGMVLVSAVRSRRPPLERGGPWSPAFSAEREHVLTSEQEAVLAEVRRALESRTFRAMLLHGVTASGKTEVYIRAIGECLRLGRGAMVLVPEISLTPQIAARFCSRLGDRVAVLHSRLAPGERYDEWSRVAAGEADVVIGARSAVFAPVRNLGMIVVDEEHETSYKQEESPRYHARDVAFERARRQNACVIFGSATPSAETFQAAASGRISCMRLPHRIAGMVVPEVVVVDMRQEHAAGNRGLLSRLLVAELQSVAASRGQAIIFLNRRGHSTFVLCRECGTVLKCTNCDVSLVLHSEHRLACHYCGARYPVPDMCPRCHGVAIDYFGAGTQKVEEEISRVLPGAQVARMDLDTTRGRHAHERILGRFAAGEIDVLVGTQMIAKGLDFPRVMLVGVVSADVALNLPDFRSAERCFQLLLQVAGRAGRGGARGRVIVQTYRPSHPSVLFSANGDYDGFMAREIEERKAASYPPFVRLIRLVFHAEREEDAALAARAIAGRLAVAATEVLGRSAQAPPAARVLGPAPATPARLKGEARWHLLVKTEHQACNAFVSGLRAVLEEACAPGGILSSGRVRLEVDVDPVSVE